MKTTRFEKKYREKWAEIGLNKARDGQKPKFYCLDMFPYPSGEGLHVGHWRGYVLSDVWTRFQILKGKNVLHPMGFDAFGLPAENAAISRKTHPRIFTQKAIEKFKEQLDQIGSLYDWSREINTSESNYYKWTQWLFLKLYENGLAYRKKAAVNFCPSCQTVLANEQVINGACERCQSEVIKKELKQWFFKITDYAERLLDDLGGIDWPERTKILQKNWIGRSEGAEIQFSIFNFQFSIPVFTTRPDTLFGATYLVLAPEHELVLKITTPENLEKVKKYISKSSKISERERTSLEREKSGVFTGAYAINPANNKKIPIWVADYVLKDYGTGAIMCVPAHDERDFEFAQKFDLPISEVISANGEESPKFEKAYTNEGVMINSDEFSGHYTEEGKKEITKWLENKGVGKKAITYRLRDWLVSRQRYWGAPIPIIHCSKCGEVPVPEKDLPVELPENVDFRPKGKSPLENSSEFINVKCPKCGAKAKRETDTLDTFVCSSWYYLRYTDPKNSQKPFDKEKAEFWLPVDLYIGGIEHAILHLLYARFISKFLHDIKKVDFDPLGEPFKKLFNIGMIHYKGAKMSKSKGNIVSPDELVKKYGSDALRGYELFIGPADEDAEWMDKGILGISRFLNKVKKINEKVKNKNEDDSAETELNKTIQKVTDDIENFRMNTAISAFMKFINKSSNDKTQMSKEQLEKFLILMSPIFPRLSEELWVQLGNKESIFKEKWPVADKNLIKDEKITIIIQVNGKLRGKIEADEKSSQNEIVKLSQNSENIKKWLNGKTINKTIFIPKKLVNFVL